MALAPGTRLGPYEIVAPLGAGGMGEVYRACDPRLDREVAIKVIPATLAADREHLARFEQEARTAGTLHHPGICTVLDVGTQDGAPFVVMELLEGETLRERLRRGRLPWRKVAEHAAAIAQALAAAHEKGIVHRDLKPENLFLTRDGRVKVLDFGLAKLVHPDGLAMSGLDTLSVGMTESGAILGTAGYMAPEQVRGLAADARADLFALGAVMFEMLTGERAFMGASFVETGSAILNREPELDPAGARGIPAGLKRVVEHCLEKGPEQRFRSARDLAFVLESLAGSDGVAASAVPPASSQPPAPRAIAPLLIVAALIAGLAVGAVVARRVGGVPGPATVHFGLLPPPGGRFRFDLEESTPFAISPDGRTLAFVASDSSGMRRACLRSLGEGAARSLAGTDGAHSLCWSPDGRSLGVFLRHALRRCRARLGRRGECVRDAGRRHLLRQLGARWHHPVRLDPGGRHLPGACRRRPATRGAAPGPRGRADRAGVARVPARRAAVPLLRPPSGSSRFPQARRSRRGLAVGHGQLVARTARRCPHAPLRERRDAGLAARSTRGAGA